MASKIFNLASPPNFRGLDPDKPLSVYYRHMPHWRQDGVSYFVTFRLADSLPCEKIQYLKRIREEWERLSPSMRTKEVEEQHAKNVLQYVETSLDEGHGNCHFRDPRLAAEMKKGLLHFHTERYFLSCFVVMPQSLPLGVTAI